MNDAFTKVVNPNYDPVNLFNTIRKHLNIKNDAALARVLGVAPPIISKHRHKVIPVGACILIRMHEVSGIAIKELRALMGDTADIFVPALLPTQGKKNNVE